MNKWKMALCVLMPLILLAAFCISLWAEVVPHPEDLALKLKEIKSQAPEVAADLKANPKQAHGMPARIPTTQILYEGFEGGVIPPTGWTTIVNNSYTWEIDNYAPFEGYYYASCFYDASYSGTQDEWLVTPVIDLSQKTSWNLKFAWQGSYYWSVDPYDNYDLEVYISTDGGSTFPTLLWAEDNIGQFDNWIWYLETIDLSAYSTEDSVKIGFRYYGYDGAQFSLDAIEINDEALPIGRCCYGDPEAPSCVDTTEAACDALGGDWTYGLNCTNNPCPIAPPNDDCSGATLISGPFPQTVNGSNEGATIDCPGVLDWEAVWYKFEAPYACNDITIDHCGSPYAVECVGVVLYGACDDCANYLLHSNTEWNDCGGPSTQPTTYWDNLPGPAVYYYPVFIGDIAVSYTHLRAHET